MCEYVGHGHLEQNWLQRNLFEKLVPNAWLFKVLCYTMCMHMSYNMPTEQRVILLVIWSKIDRKTKHVLILHSLWEIVRINCYRKS